MCNDNFLMHPTTKRLYTAAAELRGIEGQSAVAQAMNVSPQRLNNWEERGISKDGMILAEQTIGCSALWLKTGTGEMAGRSALNMVSEVRASYNVSNVLARHPDDPLGEDDVLVPEYRVSFSAGPGCAPEYEIVEESEPAIYKISWFRKERINPRNAKRFKVRHDSMVPLLYPGDTILVNLAENSIADIIDGKVYAIRYGNELRVKKLQALLDGSLVLKSENPAYHDEILTPEKVEEHITIIGRVRDKSGSGGL